LFNKLDMRKERERERERAQYQNFVFSKNESKIHRVISMSCMKYINIFRIFYKKILREINYFKTFRVTSCHKLHAIFLAIRLLFVMQHFQCIYVHTSKIWSRVVYIIERAIRDTQLDVSSFIKSVHFRYLRDIYLFLLRSYQAKKYK